MFSPSLLHPNMKVRAIFDVVQSRQGQERANPNLQDGVGIRKTAGYTMISCGCRCMLVSSVSSQTERGKNRKFSMFHCLQTVVIRLSIVFRDVRLLVGFGSLNFSLEP